MYFYFILSVNIIGEMYDELHVLFALMYNLRNALCAHTHRSGPPRVVPFIITFGYNYLCTVEISKQLHARCVAPG